MTLLVNPQRLLLDVLTEASAPPPPIDYLKWAKENIRFSDTTSDYPGGYNEALFPFFTEILHALGPDDPCRFVTLRKSAQVGGTILANIFTLGTMDIDPCLFLYVHPTDENGDRWSKQKLTPMIKESPRLSALLPENIPGVANAVRYKEHAFKPGAAIQVAGANSAANLSQMTCKKQVHDDMSKWEDNSGGDPEDQAASRSKTAAQAKIFKISTPLISPGCRISRSFDEGSQEQYHVPCKSCGVFQPLVWENARENISADAPDLAFFTCVACHAPIYEKDRAWMVDPANGAHWVAKYPERKTYHRSFDFWFVYGPLESWSSLSRAWLKVQRGEIQAKENDSESRSVEQTFFNDTLGQPMVLDKASIDWEVLRDRAETGEHIKGTVPDRALALFLGIDVQETWVQWTLWGFGENGYRVPVDHGRFDGLTGTAGFSAKEHTGNIREPEIRLALDRLVARQWRDQSGIARFVDMTAIDGNYLTDEVYDWAKKHPRSKVIMVRGGNNDHAPPILQVQYSTNKRGQKIRNPYSDRFYTFNSSAFKLRLLRDLARTNEHGADYIDLPRGMGDDFWQQLTAEVRTMKRIGGRERYVWQVLPGRRNENLDNATQAMTAAYRKGLMRWSAAEWQQRRDDLAARAAVPTDLEDLMTTGLQSSKPTNAKQSPPKAQAAPEPQSGPSAAQKLSQLRNNRRG